MVASVSHVFIKTVITALITCKIASTQNATLRQIPEDISNFTADNRNTKEQLTELTDGKNMGLNSLSGFGNISNVRYKQYEQSNLLESSCPKTRAPELGFSLSSDGNSGRRYVDVHYTNVWHNWTAIGMNMNFICGNDTACDCNGHPLNFNFCWSHKKFITQENSTCYGENQNCKERFDVVTGNCCVQMFVFCKEFTAWDALPFSSQSRLVLIGFNEIVEDKVKEKGSYKKHVQVIIASSALGVFLSATVIIAIVYRFSKPRTTHSTEMDLECTESSDLMLKHISDSDISESSSLLTSETSCILVIFYPENEISKHVQKFLMDLESTLACKVVTATQSVDDIATNGVSEWAYHSVRNANKIIVISSKAAFQNDQLRKQTQNTCDTPDNNLLQRTFLLQWTTLINDQRLKNNYHKVFNVRFNTTDLSHVFTDIVPGRHYVIPQNYHQLVRHLKF